MINNTIIINNQYDVKNSKIDGAPSCQQNVVAKVFKPKLIVS